MNKIINIKNGFTLIELLAVIVILSIVSIIAVPAISEMLSDARETAAKRSVELFVKSFKGAVSEHNLNGETIIENGVFTTSDGHEFTYGNDKILNVEYNGKAVICGEIELYSDGNVYLNECRVDDYELINYTYGVQEGE